MKRLKKIFICTLALGVTVSSCKKSFLDETPTSQIAQEDLSAAAKQDPTLLGGLLAGLYANMYTDFIGGTTGHDDFGQKGIDIYSDMLFTDMSLGALNYGWYSTIERHTAVKDYSSNPVYIPWRYYYKQVLAANNVIDVLGGTNTTPATAALKAYMGQAKAMRAYAYLYLANLYSAKGYGTGSERILPLYTNSKDINQPTSTSAVVYNQIIQDLTDAVNLLTGYTRKSKSEIDIDVAKGLLAYAYAARGTTADLNQVVSLTNDILAKYPLTTASQAVGVFNASNQVTNPESGFNSLATSSWMWGYDITLDTGLDLVSWWGQMDIYTYSYAWAGDPKFIDQGLYNAIPANDIRKKQFFDNPAPNNYGGLLPQGKFFDAGRVEGGQRSVTDDYIYMRADEMQLLNAEAYCRLGNDASAKLSLAKLVSLRYSTTNYPTYAAYLATLSGTAISTTATPAPNSLLEEIYLQTRIELWGEGKMFFALKRLKHPALKGTNHLFDVGALYQYDAPELTFPIPSAEVLYNPNLNK